MAANKVDVYSPYDNHLIKSVPAHTPAEVEKALDTAYKLFHDRKRHLPLPERIAILEKALAIITKRCEDLAKQSAEEGGKPLMDSIVEAKRTAEGLKTALDTIPHITGTQIPMQTTLTSMNRIAYTMREPIGVVFAISAFNHPINLITHQVIPAIAVGCPVIVKPATATPISCYNLVNILHEAGLPKEWAQVVICDNDTTGKVVADPRISFLSFIGSAKVGWMLRSKLPPGASCALEHGGAAPVIVENDADIDDMIPLLVKGGFYHAGQVCVSVQRVFVHEDICQQVAQGISAGAKKLIVGDPVDPKTEVGPLIRHAEVDRVEEWVKQAKSNGGEILCGGKRISESCFEPTVILNPSEDSNVSQKEIFGPVVCVYSYKDRHEAIRRANQLPFCFQSAVFTKNLDVALDTVKRLSATAVMVNDHTAFRVDWMPFGGRKDSGMNMGGIPYSMHDMSAEKLVVFRSPVL